MGMVLVSTGFKALQGKVQELGSIPSISTILAADQEGYRLQDCMYKIAGPIGLATTFQISRGVSSSPQKLQNMLLYPNGRGNGLKIHSVLVRVQPGVPISRGDGTGIHTCLRSKVLRVRIPPSA